MTTNLLYLLIPLPLIAAGLIGLGFAARFPRPSRMAEAAAFTAFLLAIAQSALSIKAGSAAHADLLALVMTLLVTFVGWVVVRFATTYLRGEPRQSAFLGFLCLTLASVVILVGARDLLILVPAWIATSLILHRLLLFYPDRPAARRAARKKFITARLGDAALIGASLFLVAAYRTTDIPTILAAAHAGAGGTAAIVAASLLALAALLKSAQFPTHGWLTEVMETPTPVSALLHAGVINAGGFLLIRFADVMLLAPGALAALVLIGGFTALFGSIVMLTQPAVKTSLAWSTVAQMGFMIFECGLALFPLALLHIVAHSLYKAHSFLSSGGAVERVAAIRRPGPVAVPGPRAVLRAFLAALLVYCAVGLLFGFTHKPAQANALGIVLIFGVAYIFAQGFADAAPKALSRRTALYALAVSVSYFALQTATSALTAGSLPPAPPAGALEWALMVLAILSFGTVAFGQCTFPLWSHHPAAGALRVHIANGFYANALFDRLIGAWSRPAALPASPES